MIRAPLLGHPHCYYVEARIVLEAPLFASAPISEVLSLIEALRNAFDLRCYGYALTSTSLHLAIQHPQIVMGNDTHLQERWLAGGGSPTPIQHLRTRLSSLGGFMQTLLQRIARTLNRHHGTHGTLWASRYRACLLADDAAVLAATTWIETGIPSLVAGSLGLPANEKPILLALPPLRIGPDDQWYPVDDSPPGLPPPATRERAQWLQRIAAELAPDLAEHTKALRHGWALGRAESLTSVLARLGRATGRGRSRRLRDLDDAFGLCGVWG